LFILLYFHIFEGELLYYLSFEVKRGNLGFEKNQYYELLDTFALFLKFLFIKISKYCMR